MDVTISELKVVALVDTNSTHKFLRGWRTWGLHHKDECNESLFKTMKSTVKPMVKVIHLAPLRFTNG